MQGGYPYAGQAARAAYPAAGQKEAPFVWNFLRASASALLSFLMLAVLLFIFLPGIRAYFLIEPSFHDDGSEGRLQIELAALRRDYLGSLGACVKEAPEVVEDLSLQPLPKDERAEVEEVEESREVLSVRLTPPPPKPAPPAPKPAPPAPKPAPPAPKPAPPAPKSGPPSKIEDVKDLEGCWEVEPGFVSVRYRKRMLHRYCFDKTGNASSYSANLDSRGNVTRDCKNTAKATLKGKDFVLRSHDPPPCPGWRAGVYTCTLVATGVMQCGLDHGGDIDYTKFYYQGTKK
jgi:hypothetical protein